MTRLDTTAGLAGRSGATDLAQSRVVRAGDAGAYRRSTELLIEPPSYCFRPGFPMAGSSIAFAGLRVRSLPDASFHDYKRRSMLLRLTGCDPRLRPQGCKPGIYPVFLDRAME